MAGFLRSIILKVSRSLQSCVNIPSALAAGGNGKSCCKNCSAALGGGADKRFYAEIRVCAKFCLSNGDATEGRVADDGKGPKENAAFGPRIVQICSRRRLHSEAFEGNASKDSISGVGVPKEAHGSDSDEEDGVAHAAELEEELEALQEADPGDARIPIVSLRLAQEYDLLQEAPEKILRLAQQALKAFGVVDDDTLHLGMCLQLIGAAYLRMDKLELSLDNLRRSLAFFEKKQQQGQHVDPFRFLVLWQVGNVNAALGKNDEAVESLCESLQIQEALLEDENPQLAGNFRRAAEICSDALRFSEARHLAERAVQLHRLSYGADSEEEARDHQLLSTILVGLNDHETALHHLHAARKILINHKMKDLSALDLSIADAQITLGKYDEAIVTLEGIIKQIPETDPIRAMVHVNLAKSYFQQNKVKEAMQHCSMAREIFSSSSDADLLAVGKGLVELASVYENLNEIEKSVDVLQQALEILEQIPEELDEVADAQAHIGMQLIFLGRVEEGLPYLEDSLERLRNIFGKQHHVVARVLKQIGLAYLELEEHTTAIDYLEEAKESLTTTYGKDSPETISVIRNLVDTYAIVGRTDLVAKYRKQIASE